MPALFQNVLEELDERTTSLLPSYVQQKSGFVAAGRIYNVQSTTTLTAEMHSTEPTIFAGQW